MKQDPARSALAQWDLVQWDLVGSAQLLFRRGDQGRGPAMIAFGNHQTARDRADAAFDEAGMMIEDKAVDAGLAQPDLSPGQADDVIGAQQLLHPPPNDLLEPTPIYVLGNIPGYVLGNIPGYARGT